MAATYITVAEFRTLVGIGDLYSDVTIEEVCQTAQDLLDGMLWYDSAPVVGALLNSNVITLGLTMPTIFTTGQTVAITGCGATYNNAAAVITGTIPYSQNSVNSFIWPNVLQNIRLNNVAYIQYAKVAADDNWHQIRPFGKALGADTKAATYATTGGVRNAAAVLARAIWDSRQAAGGGLGVDGSVLPFTVGARLMGQVKGLIAPYMNPAAMVG